MLCLAAIALVCSGADSAHADKFAHHKPAHSGLPAITGLPQVGSMLHTSRGRWVGASRFTYHWKVCDAHGGGCKLVGEARRTRNRPGFYLVTASDVGRRMRVTVVASNKWGKDSATSKATAVIVAPRLSGTGTGSGSPPTSGPINQPAPGSLGSGQSLAFWLAWSGAIQESEIPWSGVTQVSMFALKTTNGTSLDTSSNTIDKINVPAWVSMIHQHGRLAIISIGGSNDDDWQYACDSTNRSGFTTNLVNYMVDNGFDGVDLDIEQGFGSDALVEACVQSIAKAAHATLTQAGKVPLVTEDIDESLMTSPPYDTLSVDYSYLDQVNLMYYGDPVGSWNCGAGTPYGTCATVGTHLQKVFNTGMPKSKIMLGSSPGGGQAQCCYSDLATTNATVSGPITSIPVASIPTEIPAGNIVLATTQNPPSNYQFLTTSGAAACSSDCSIPITGAPTWGSGTTANHSYPSGSYVQDAYMGPWDCGNFARYATANGLEGVMIWDLQEEAGEHNGQFPCVDQVASYVAGSP